eukprot:CAMPEP_0197187410 /NCGR_PEP_ID=MMETSP1423-20130617/15798_1 /TAXON_ID=476441 /ORGANISM="Pseudo-nitzschia heimii, Strain UNC1101" /LENGTH=307 /DNA_ID=CAMNT_0042638973 /DNA_START=21 /DNA_END=944 /DNA_ORIENTATION=+
MHSVTIAIASVLLSALVALRVDAVDIQRVDGTVGWGDRRRRTGSFRATYDADVAGEDACGIVYLIAVGTAMKTGDFDQLSKSISEGSPIVTVFFDHNPGNIVKLDQDKYAGFYNAFAGSLSEHLPAVCEGKSPTIVAGGHSAGGHAGLKAMETKAIAPDGFVGLSPFPVSPKKTFRYDAVTIDPDLPVLTWGFTRKTCSVDPALASESQYELSGKTNRVLFRANNDDGAARRVGHCEFSDDGCFPVPIPNCPSPKTTDVKDVVARSMKVFAESLKTTGTIDQSTFRGFDTSNPSGVAIDVLVDDDEL